MQKRHLLGILLCNLAAIHYSYAIPQEAIIKGFVNLADVDPTIKCSLRYLTSENFLGRPVRGYKDPVVMVTKAAADALKKIQDSMLKDGYSLVIYDAYRPQQAVDDFITWAKDTDESKKAYYYPQISKQNCFKEGYIAERSGHSAGSVVDITIIEVGKEIHPVKAEKRRLTDGTEVYFLDDGTVDMGTSFDFFGKASHSGNNPLVSKQANNMRAYLAKKMAKHGFEVTETEWWHFRLTKELEPHRGNYFDFPVEK